MFSYNYQLKVLKYAKYKSYARKLYNITKIQPHGLGFSKITLPI